MKRIMKITLLSTVLTLGMLSSNNTYAQAGGAAVPFLLISPDARSSGMGEVGTAIADDINAIYWNTAGLGFHDYVDDPDKKETDREPWRQVSLSFSKWLPQFNADLYYSYFTIGQYFKQLDGTAAFNFILMNLGEFQRTDVNGNKLGAPFNSTEFSVGLSYGTIVATDFAIGFQLRYIQSNLTPSAGTGQNAGIGVSGAFDLGLLWKPKKLEVLGLDMSDMISFGLNLQNVGPKMTYISASDPIPTNLRLGTAVTTYKDEFSDWKFGLDISKLLVRRDDLGSDPLPKSFITAWKNPGVQTSIGTEYWYEQIIALRAGYFTEPATLGNRKFWNFGLGVRYDIFSLDFSYINTIEDNNPLANTMRFSMIINWN